MGGTSKSSKSVDPFNIETHGDWGSPMTLEAPIWESCHES